MFTLVASMGPTEGPYLLLERVIEKKEAAADTRHKRKGLK